MSCKGLGWDDGGLEKGRGYHMSFLISPPEETAWHSDVRALADALRRAWPGAEVILTAGGEGSESLEWTVPYQWPLRGHVDSTRQAIVVDGDLDDCARFALWFRGYVPSGVSLVFYDDGYSADVSLVSGISTEQIAEPFRPS